MAVISVSYSCSIGANAEKVISFARMLAAALSVAFFFFRRGRIDLSGRLVSSGRARFWQQRLGGDHRPLELHGRAGARQRPRRKYGRGRPAARHLRAARSAVAIAGLAVTFLLPHLRGRSSPADAARVRQRPGGQCDSLDRRVSSCSSCRQRRWAPRFPCCRGCAVGAAADRFGVALGRLYGWNTLGAVVGVVAAELILVDRFGVAGAAWTAAVLNLARGRECCLGLSGRASERASPTAPSYKIVGSGTAFRPSRSIERDCRGLCGFCVPSSCLVS